jgi:predicted RNA-binding protein YlxR (DUF448 family)
VSKKRVRKPKHIPQRTCVGCNQVLAKRALIRIVRTEEGVKIDPTGKHPGRGAYLHELRSCWQVGINKSLAHSLRTPLTPDDIDHLTSYMNTIPEVNNSLDNEKTK